MKYKLINRTTGIETLCDKVTIDGFDYYLSENYKDGDYVILPISLSLAKCVNGTTFIEGTQKVIATNNPNIDIPKLVDEVETLAESIIPNLLYKKYVKTGFIGGYNKSQETHPFSEEDMIEFAEFVYSSCKEYQRGGTYVVTIPLDDSKTYTIKELLQIWKEQQPKIVYYG